jgi:hypothetical protein
MGIGPQHYSALPRRANFVSARARGAEARFRKWLRGSDSNRRPSAYEADALPDCATPRKKRPRGALICGSHTETSIYYCPFTASPNPVNPVLRQLPQKSLLKPVVYD